MGVMDKVTSLLQWRRDRGEPEPRQDDTLALRDGFDRWLQRLVEEPWSGAALLETRWMPSADVQETDDEVIVNVEVPGLAPGDLDLTITPQGLIIRGEKREEREDRRASYHLSECRYGSFVRTVPLPRGIDPERAEARVENGVLTVRFPKAGSRSGGRRVPIER